MSVRRNRKVERVRHEKARLEANSQNDSKPMKPARSQAELTAIKQRNIQIVLSLVILAVSAVSLLANLDVI